MRKAEQDNKRGYPSFTSGEALKGGVT